MIETKKDKIINRLEHHLRMTSRQLIKMGTEEEAIHYLIDSFKSELYCDFVGVILADADEFVPKAWGEEREILEMSFRWIFQNVHLYS